MAVVVGRGRHRVGLRPGAVCGGWDWRVWLDIVVSTVFIVAMAR
jgi:hypothetical protein